MESFKAEIYGNILLDRLEQYRITINFPDEVIMLSNKKFVNDFDSSKI